MWQNLVVGALVAMSAVYAVKIFAPRWFAKHVRRGAAKAEVPSCGCGSAGACGTEAQKKPSH